MNSQNIFTMANLSEVAKRNSLVVLKQIAKLFLLQEVTVKRRAQNLSEGSLIR